MFNQNHQQILTTVRWSEMRLLVCVIFLPMAMAGCARQSSPGAQPYLQYGRHVPVTLRKGVSMVARRLAHQCLSTLLCLGLIACAPSKKTGTVTDGVVKGIAVAQDGSLGKLDVELTVKLDDGKEVKATHMIDQDKAKTMKGKRVEVEPVGGGLWKVIRVLN